MSLPSNERKRIQALAEGSIEPANGMEIHFVNVVKGKSIACSPKEKEWLAYWRSLDIIISEPIGNNNPVKLLLYDAGDDNWIHDCTCILKENDMLVLRKGLNWLHAWKEENVREITKQVGFCEAVEMATVWLSPERDGIRLNSKRLYFENDDTSHPIEGKKEYDILGSFNRPETTNDALLKQLLDIGNILVQGNALISCVTSNDSEPNALKLTHAVGNENSKFNLAFDLWKGWSTAGAYYIPDQFKITLVYDTTQPEWKWVVHTYYNYLIKEWLPELGVMEAGKVVHPLSLDDALAQVKKIEQRERFSQLEGEVFLVAISGKPGDPLPPQQKEFLSLLDLLQQQYRAFSYDNTKPNWASRGQVSSILQGAGGVPYRLILPIPEEIDDCLIYGVDIGHDHKKKRVSRVVVSVTDKYGSHIASVWIRQKLNEAAASEILGDMLRKARHIASSEIGSSGKMSIVLRDGLIPKKRPDSGAECLDTYLDTLGPDTTVVECRKRGNPIMYIDGGRAPTPATAGDSSTREDSVVRFVCTHVSDKGLANIYKIHIPKGGDGLGIGLNTMCQIITGLCYSPSLGLRAHLPGPIYWADGIGKTGPDQYKFKGQRVYEFTY